MNQSNQPTINYGRPLPPVETRWKKGQSGNPNGRPRKDNNIGDLLEELMNAVCPADSENRTYAHQLVRSLVHQGLIGNLGAIKEIFNRLAGRVPFLIERIGVSSNQPDQKFFRDGNSARQGFRTKMSLQQKNEILEILGIEPLGEPASPNENATG